MDLNRVIQDLYEEKKRLDRIIGSLEELQRAAESPILPPERRRGRKFMDTQARLEVSRRMKSYWESRRKGDIKIARQITNGAPGQQL